MEEEFNKTKERAECILSGLRLEILNKWEREFIESIEERIEDDLSLTERQMDKLEEIYRHNMF